MAENNKDTIELEDEVLSYANIRKSVAVFAIPYYLSTKKSNGKPMSKRQLDMAIQVPEGTISHWCDTKQKSRRPTTPHLKSIARILNVKLAQLVGYALNCIDEDKYQFDQNERSAIQKYRAQKLHQLNPTHDGSNEHLRNLSSFEDAEFNIYYLHRSTNQRESLEWMAVTTEKLINTGAVPFVMTQTKKRKNNDYYGKITAFPGLNWAQMHINQRINERVEDSGIIMVHFPEQDLDGMEYLCGCGVMLSIDRNDKKNLVLQRVVMIRVKDSKFVPTDEDKEYILKSLQAPLTSQKDYYVMISNIQELHRGIYDYIKSKEKNVQ